MSQVSPSRSCYDVCASRVREGFRWPFANWGCVWGGFFWQGVLAGIPHYGPFVSRTSNLRGVQGEGVSARLERPFAAICFSFFFSIGANGQKFDLVDLLKVLCVWGLT